jgi:hypothetical protein
MGSELVGMSLIALFGLGALSDLSPQCAPKRTLNAHRLKQFFEGLGRFEIPCYRQ